MSAVQTLINEVSQKIHALEIAQALYSRQLSPALASSRQLSPALASSRQLSPALASSRQLSPDFNTFDYINTDELGLSRILAFLLDPQGNHAQQETFLKLFIEHCLPDMYEVSERQIFLNNIEKTEVFLEEVTRKSNSLRRMDIYLRCKVDDENYGICIENKPYAVDQPNQLIDYYNELIAKGHTDPQIVYLSEYNDTPNPASVDAETLKCWIDKKQCSHLRFSDLTGWLKACQVECQNHSVSEFLTQLIKFIQKQFMGIENMSESNAVLDIIKRNGVTIDASIKVSNTINRMKKELITKLKIDLLAKCKTTDYKLDINDFGEGKNYEQINFIIPSYDAGYICFEFQGENFDRPCLGIKLRSMEEAKNHLHTEKMKTTLNTALADKKIWSSSRWPAGYYFYPQDWKGSSEAWLMINEDTMADKILEEMDIVFNTLKANDCFTKY